MRRRKRAKIDVFVNGEIDLDVMPQKDYDVLVTVLASKFKEYVKSKVIY